MWVPWRAGHTAAEQARIRRNRSGSGRAMTVKDRKAAVKQANKAHRKDLMKQLKKGKITPQEYRKAIRRYPV